MLQSNNSGIKLFSQKDSRRQAKYSDDDLKHVVIAIKYENFRMSLYLMLFYKIYAGFWDHYSP